MVETKAGVKARFAIPSTIQRTGLHFASQTDSEEAYATGKKAVELAIQGVSGKMVTLVREKTSPYAYTTGTADLSDVANGEKLFPKEWISEDGFFVTEKFFAYARPLIMGEVNTIIEDGLPQFMRFRRIPVSL